MANPQLQTFDSVIGYLNYVYDTYFLSDENLRNIRLSNLSVELKKLIITFGNAQDKAFNPDFIDKTEFEGSEHTDDLYEIYFMLKYAEDDDNKNVTLMHDAWTLSKMKVFNKSGIYYAFDETGNNLSNIRSVSVLTSQNFATFYAAANDKQHPDHKKPIAINYRANCILIVQCRRLTQFYSYECLTKEEMDKDRLPVDTYTKLIRNNSTNMKIAKQLL